MNFTVQRSLPGSAPINIAPMKKKKVKIPKPKLEPIEEVLEKEDIPLYKDLATVPRGSQEQFGPGYGHPNSFSRNI